MDTKYVCSPLVIRQRKFYPPVKPTWSHEGRIEGIRPAQKSAREKSTHGDVLTCW